MKCIGMEAIQQQCDEAGQTGVPVGGQIIVLQSTVLPLDAVVGADAHMKRARSVCCSPALNTTTRTQVTECLSSSVYCQLASCAPNIAVG